MGEDDILRLPQELTKFFILKDWWYLWLYSPIRLPSTIIYDATKKSLQLTWWMRMTPSFMILGSLKVLFVCCCCKEEGYGCCYCMLCMMCMPLDRFFLDSKLMLLIASFWSTFPSINTNINHHCYLQNSGQHINISIYQSSGQ